MLEYLKDLNVPLAAAMLTASSVMLAAAGNRLKIPGGVELRGRADELLEKTGRKIGSDISRTVLQKKLIQADLKIQPEYFAGLQLALPVIVLTVFIPPALLGWLDFYWGVVFAVISFLIPGLWLNQKAKARIEAIRKDIPEFCMLLGNALRGADLLLALEMVARSMPGDLSAEINKGLADMATGDSRVAALNKMAQRCGIPELTGLVNRIQQAARYGSPLEPVVVHHAEKILTRRKQETQKVAGELTIRLLFPIILFILMPLFFLIGYPIVWNMLTVFGN
ncbi:MAG: type II secretion system F family protein [Bacillota bacterium]